MQGRNRDTNVENKRMDTQGGKWRGRGGGGVMNWETGIDIYTLICIKWTTNKNLLYKKINKIQKFKQNKKKESACQCRGHRFKSWSRKIPHATEQLSP